VTSHPG